MSDDLQQKISTLEFIEQAVILVRDGKGHGPSDAGYDLVASLLGTAVLGCSAVTVFQYPMPETGVGLVTRMVAVIAPVIGALMIYKEVIKRGQINKPTWARAISDALADYKPIDQGAWITLHKQAVGKAGVDVDAQDSWLNVEMMAARKLLVKPKPTTLIPLPTFAASNPETTDAASESFPPEPSTQP